MRSTFRTFVAAAIVAAALAAGPALAGQAWYATDNVAIDGTDPVAYFTEGKPVEGKPDIAYDWMGVTWRFASTENREAFVKSPDKYAPQYGGYCAWAVSQGYTAKIDPAAWSIVDDKLYLNYSKSIQSRWALNKRGNIVKADANWPDLRKDLEAK